MSKINVEEHIIYVLFMLEGGESPLETIALGKRIKALRRLKRMTQQKLAEQLDLSPSLLSNIERGVKKPKAELLEKMAATLNIPKEEFFILPLNRNHSLYK